MSTYLSIRPLELRNSPAIVVRDEGDSHIVWEPTAPRLELVAWMLDTLRPEELQAVCGAYGVSFPLPSWTVSSRPLMLFVPKALRLPGASPIPDCEEYWRRASLDQLDMERAAYLAEQLGTSVDLQQVHERSAGSSGSVIDLRPSGVALLERPVEVEAPVAEAVPEPLPVEAPAPAPEVRRSGVRRRLGGALFAAAPWLVACAAPETLPYA